MFDIPLAPIFSTYISIPAKKAKKDLAGRSEVKSEKLDLYKDYRLRYYIPKATPAQYVINFGKEESLVLHAAFDEAETKNLNMTILTDIKVILSTLNRHSCF